ncbi:hypothetical protein [Klebsiella grimontii]|uniref:hypothetical protein n=1 Tax=Klebsiella grimontii TaxID=2058152 RepID=UPI0012B7EA35|nr:hypothetical protein [Klebsiella grimontii]MBZ7124662.1 hypothetical protein [Klebsiella grimontii]
MTNNQLTDERIEQIAVWLATESHSLNLEMLTCLRELQERRKAAAQPVAYLVCNGRLFKDRAFTSLPIARQSVKDRNDGAEIKALCVSETLTEKVE